MKKKLHRSKKNNIVPNENELVKSNMGLVKAVVLSFYPSPSEFDDYLQVGSIGLLYAIRKHDPKLGALSTIARKSIYWEILKYINKQKKHKNVLHLEFDAPQQIDKDFSLLEVEWEGMTCYEKAILILKSYGNTFKDIANIINLSNAEVSLIYYTSIFKIREMCA